MAKSERTCQTCFRKGMGGGRGVLRRRAGFAAEEFLRVCDRYVREEPCDRCERKTVPLEVEVGGKKVFSLRWLNILRCFLPWRPIVTLTEKNET